MAIGSRTQQLLVNKYCRTQCRNFLNFVSRKTYNYKKASTGCLVQCLNRKLHTTTATASGHPRLSPQEVTNILRTNEHTQENNLPESIKSYDSNQLASNNPIEDTRSEARCLLTTGMLLGIFDGHAGPSCAQVIAERMLQYITVSLLPPDLLIKYRQSLEEGQEEMKLLHLFNNNLELVDKLKTLYSSSLKSFVSDLSSGGPREFKMAEALESAFLRLDGDLSREALPDARGRLNKRTLSVAMSGAVACVAHVDGPHLHVASAGDCQAVIGVLGDGRAWSPLRLTREHNVDNQGELARILAEHPANEADTVIRMERLLGQLAPLRALGDFKYKWSREQLEQLVVPNFGEQHMPPNYHTPPYLTARPEVISHRLRPRDKFLVMASDGLWDLISPLQVVRLVGEHMSGKVTLSPLHLPRKDMSISDINKMLLQRKEGLSKKPIDSNAATHLMRNALGGTEYGIDHGKLSRLLSLPEEVVRCFRDDITITVVYFDSQYLRNCP